MPVSPRVLALVERHEGRRPRPYKDTLGYTTIGIGRNLTVVGLSTAEMDYLFRNDLERARIRCVALFPKWSELSDVRRAVLTDMMFNLGPRGLRGFHIMRAAIRRGDFLAAAVAMNDSRWAVQVGAKPKQRAWRLAKMMKTDEWPTS